MITFLLVTGLIISIIINVLTIILAGINANKIRTYEEYILGFKQSVQDTLQKMRDIDTKGSFATRVDDTGKFECDDEVGIIFKELEELLEDLNKIIE